MSFYRDARVRVGGNHVVGSIRVRHGQLTLDIDGVLRVSSWIDMGTNNALTIRGGELRTDGVVDGSYTGGVTLRVENGGQLYVDREYSLDNGSALIIERGCKAEFGILDISDTAPTAIRAEGVHAELVIRDALRGTGGSESGGSGQILVSNGAHLRCGSMELSYGDDPHVDLEPQLKVVDAFVTVQNKLHVGGFAGMAVFGSSEIEADEVRVGGRLLVAAGALVHVTQNIVVGDPIRDMFDDQWWGYPTHEQLGEIILEGGTIEAQKIILNSNEGEEGQDSPPTTSNPCLDPTLNEWSVDPTLYAPALRGRFATLRGAGYVRGELVSYGRVKPEFYASITGSPSWTNSSLLVEGNYRQGDLGLMQVEISPGPGERAAQFRVDGTAELSGGLDLTVQDPTRVAPGNRTLVLVADKIEGEFCRFPGAVLPEPLNDSLFAGLDYASPDLENQWADDGLWVMILKVPTLADGSPLPGLPSSRPNALPGIPTLFGPLGERIALVTHGTRSTATGPGDIGEIADLMEQFNAAHFAHAEWQVLKFDWREYATGKDDSRHFLIPFHPVESARIGAAIGRSLVDWLIELDPYGYEAVAQWHLLSHSSGSWLVDAMSDRIKEKGPNRGLPPEVLEGLPFDAQSPVPVHVTYFDAFALAGSPWLANLGQLADTADFAEQYVDGNCLPPPTNSTLPDVVNVDVTLLNPDWPIVPDMVAFHAWPYQWYIRTIRAALTEPFEPCDVDATCAWQQWGFVLSPMYRDYAQQVGVSVVDTGALVRGTPRYIVPANYTGHKDFGCLWVFHEAGDLLQQAVSLAGEGWHKVEDAVGSITIHVAAGSEYEIGVPVPAVLPGPTPSPVRGIAFDYHFLTPDAAELTVLQGDTEVWKTGSDFARSMDMESSLIPLAEQDPDATAPLRFSLASLDDADVEVVISNTRYATMEQSGDQQPSDQPDPPVAQPGPGPVVPGLCGMGTMTMLPLALLSLGGFSIARGRRSLRCRQGDPNKTGRRGRKGG